MSDSAVVALAAVADVAFIIILLLVCGRVMAKRVVRPLLERIDSQRDELLQKNAQLEQAVKMRREFTGNVSHEMKTPLQVIGGYAELIECGAADPGDVRRFAGLIRDEADTMRSLIDDVLMLSRLDEGAAEPFSPFDLTSVCKRVVARLGEAADERGVTLGFAKGFDAMAQATGSLALAEQAVYNLVDNALRHGRRQGNVMISLEIQGPWVLVAVDDDGPGVPPEARERVFERFFRVDASRSRETGGTGLGLAIVKHAAASMGGAVTVDSSPLGGARFELRLPRHSNVSGERI